MKPTGQAPRQQPMLPCHGRFARHFLSSGVAGVVTCANIRRSRSSKMLSNRRAIHKVPCMKALGMSKPSGSTRDVHVAESRAQQAMLLRRQEYGIKVTDKRSVCQASMPGWMRLQIKVDRQERVAKFATVGYRGAAPDSDGLANSFIKTPCPARVSIPYPSVSPPTANESASQRRFCAARGSVMTAERSENHVFARSDSSRQPHVRPASSGQLLISSPAAGARRGRRD